MSKDKKKKKPKTVYVDDGRTLADMSGVSGGYRGPKKTALGKSAWQTYKESVKLMFVPMLVTMGIITVAFGIMYLVLAFWF